MTCLPRHSRFPSSSRRIGGWHYRGARFAVAGAVLISGLYDLPQFVADSKATQALLIET